MRFKAKSEDDSKAVDALSQLTDEHRRHYNMVSAETERKALELRKEGLSQREIGRTLEISPRTVAHIFQRNDPSSIAQDLKSLGRILGRVSAKAADRLESRLDGGGGFSNGELSVAMGVSAQHAHRILTTINEPIQEPEYADDELEL